MEPAARDRFQELTDRLRKQTLDRFVEGLSEAIQGTTPEELQANREMVRDLNSLLEERLEGREPSQGDVDDFLSRHGQFFPGRPNARRHRRAAHPAHGRDAVAPAVDDPAAAGGAPIDDGRTAPRRPAAMGPRPTRLEHGPAHAGRARRGLRLLAARRGSASSRRWSRSGDSRRSTRWRTPSPRSQSRATWPGSIAMTLRELLGDDAARDLDALDELARQLERGRRT